MFKRWLILATALGIWWAIGTMTMAADVAKIGIIDFQAILEKSTAGKKAQTEINKHGKEMESDLKSKGAELEEMKNQLEREAMVMSGEKRTEKERDLRLRVQDFKTLQQKYMTEFKQKEGQLIRQIRDDVIQIIEDIGKKEGFLVILEKREAGVVYSPSSIDLTDKVIKAYNTAYAKKGGK